MVARADRGRAGVVLGLPAPRQPVAARSGPSDERVAAGRRRTTGDDELDLDRRRSTRLAERADQQPETYRWSYARDFGGRPGWSSSTPGRPGCSSRTAARCSTTTRWPGSTSRCAATSTTCSSARRCRSCCRRACTTSRRGTRRSPRARGGSGSRRSGEKLRQAVDLEHWAAFQDGFQRGRRDGRRGRRRQARRGAADGHVPVRRRPPLLRRRGRDRDAGRRAAGSSRRCARRSATRCPRHDAASRRRCWRTASPARSAGWSRGRPRCRDAPLAWKRPRGPWFDNNLAILELQDERCTSGGSPGGSTDDDDRPRLERVATVDVPLPPA